MTDSFDGLRLLFGGYLNIDWADDYDDVWAAVAHFVESEVLAQRVPSEVAAMLSSGPSEAALRRVVIEQLGSGYLPDADGWRFDDWLTELSARIVGALPDQI